MGKWILVTILTAIFLFSFAMFMTSACDKPEDPEVQTTETSQVELERAEIMLHGDYSISIFIDSYEITGSKIYLKGFILQENSADKENTFLKKPVEYITDLSRVILIKESDSVVVSKDSVFKKEN